MLRSFLLLSGVVSIIGTIGAAMSGRIDVVPPNTILIGLLCFAVADMIRRVELLEKHLNIVDSDEEKEIRPNYAHPLERPQNRPSSSKR